MTDQVVTDATFASRSGLYDFDGNAVRELAGPALGKLPSVVSPDTVVGQLKPVPGAELGLRPGIPVVIGAGDRQCEVLGSGASEDRPMVSWGTTANVSVPVHERPVPSPAGAVVTRAADGGWLLEGGLSAAGSFLAWLGRLLDRTPEELARLAGGEPARAPAAWSPCRGSTAPAPRGGATTPGPASWGWARRTAPATWRGAVMESVAWDVLRVMEVVTVGRLGGSHGGGRDPGRRRVGAARVGRGPDLGPRGAGVAPPLGRGGLGRRRVAGRQGARHGAHARPARPGGGGDRARRRRRRVLPQPTARVDHVAAAVLAATESLPGSEPAAR